MFISTMFSENLNAKGCVLLRIEGLTGKRAQVMIWALKSKFSKKCSTLAYRLVVTIL